MIRLEQSLRAWGTPHFEAILKQEVAQLDAGQLPLQQGLVAGNYVSDDPISVAVNSIVETEATIRVIAGIFYQGLMSGCSCADDPTPISKSSEYCEVQLDIDKATGITNVALLGEQRE